MTEQATEEHALLLAVDSVVPKGLNTDTRADICQDLLVDILSGELTLSALRASVSTYIRRFFRKNVSWAHVSLDAPIFGGGKRTLAEVLADTRVH